MDNKLTVTVNKTKLPIKEYQGQRVVTLKEIDTVHQRPEGTARKRFNDNKKRFIEDIDYFKVSASVFRTHFNPNYSKQAVEDITLITESGYLMLVKTFTDDLAWTVQRQLVNVYFRATPEQKQEAAKQTKSVQSEAEKRALAEAKLNNSRARMAAEWRKLASMVSIPTYKDICASHASAVLAGKEVLPLPDREERYYTATEVGKMLDGISKTQIGTLANQNGLKTEQYGQKIWDKSPFSSKEVQSFVYNEAAVERFRELLGLAERHAPTGGSES